MKNTIKTIALTVITAAIVTKLMLKKQQNQLLNLETAICDLKANH